MVLKQNVGIDVSKDDFEANFSVIDNQFEKTKRGSRKFTNDENGFMKLFSWSEKLKEQGLKVSFTIEFTGVYYERLGYFLRSKEKTVHMVIPSKSKKYCESLSIASKTDKLDAQSLSWLGLERNLREWDPISDVFLDLRTLTREREELLKERTMINNRKHAMGLKAKEQPKTMSRYGERLDLIASQIIEIEIEIKKLLQQDQKLWDRVCTIRTIPGVALITTATVLAETNGFAAILNQKQLTSYAGLDVKLNESGKFKGKSKISKQGNAHIRRVLHFPAQTAIVHNKPIHVFFERVNATKIKPMIASVGVQRKLLCMIFAIWKSNKSFDPNYEINKYGEMMKEVG